MMAQIAAVEAARDAVVEKETPADTSERMIRDLSRVRGIRRRECNAVGSGSLLRKLRQQSCARFLRGLDGDAVCERHR